MTGNDTNSFARLDLVLEFQSASVQIHQLHITQHIAYTLSLLQIVEGFTLINEIVNGNGH